MKPWWWLDLCVLLSPIKKILFFYFFFFFCWRNCRRYEQLKKRRIEESSTGVLTRWQSTERKTLSPTPNKTTTTTTFFNLLPTWLQVRRFLTCSLSNTLHVAVCVCVCVCADPIGSQKGPDPLASPPTSRWGCGCVVVAGTAGVLGESVSWRWFCFCFFFNSPPPPHLQWPYL